MSSETWQLADPMSAAHMQEFMTAWRGLDERQEMAALAGVVKEVRFDPSGGSISVTLADDALERLRRK